MSHSTGRRAVLAALGANLAVAVTKFIGFLVTASSSLLAESLHSLADTGNQLLLLLGSHRASETPSPEHPFGRGRERYFWAFVVGLVLFGFGGVFSLYEGTRKLIGGDHEVTSPLVGVLLLVVAFALEAASMRTAVREARAIRPAGQPWRKFIRRTRNPEITVVLLEDGAALAGLSIALVGIIATWITGDPIYDAAATIGIGLLLCAVATLLTVEMKSLLVGETIPQALTARTAKAIAAIPGVECVLNIRTEHLGPEQVLVCVKVELVAPADLDAVVDRIDEIEAVVKRMIPETLTCYVEPDHFDPDRVDADWS